MRWAAFSSSATWSSSHLLSTFRGEAVALYALFFCRCMEAKAENDLLGRELREHKDTAKIHLCFRPCKHQMLSSSFQALMGRELYDIEILFKLMQGRADSEV